jgi:hypothetical protein
MTLDLDTIKERPVYRIGPVTIKGLKTFLIGQGISLPDQIIELIEDKDISCKAFFYSKYGPLLLMFELKFDVTTEEGTKSNEIRTPQTEKADQFTKRGLIGILTGDAELSNLFNIKGASVRVFRCSRAKGSFETLEKYVAELSK